MNIQPATNADVAHFYGAPGVPVKMLSLTDGATIFGVAGLAWCDDGVFAVSWLKEGARQHAAAVVRLALAVLKMAEHCDQRVFATRDPDEPTADKSLRFLGFMPTGEDRYEYRTDIPGRFYVRHAKRAAGTVPADTCRACIVACVEGTP